VNAGSTTLKYSLYDVSRKSGASALESKLIASGLVDKVGISENGSITHNSSLVVQDVPIPSHTAGFEMLLDVLKKNEIAETSEIECVGHRVVHGGSIFSKPTVITNNVLDEIKQLSALAPLHNPPAASGIEASKIAFPSATQVAVFDTAFHATMPPPSYRYAIPKDLYEDHGIRKYGFHGTSFQYVMEAAADHLGKNSSDLNLIVTHLGGGASMCCIKNGKSIDTTMGLTPLEGLVMATRSGDIDPGIYDYMLKNGYTEDEVYNTLNKESGLLGLAGRSSDMRVIKAKAKKGDSDCRLARQVFSERW
jgi:acetate kinase